MDVQSIGARLCAHGDALLEEGPSFTRLAQCRLDVLEDCAQQQWAPILRRLDTLIGQLVADFDGEFDKLPMPAAIVAQRESILWKTVYAIRDVGNGCKLDRPADAILALHNLTEAIAGLVSAINAYCGQCNIRAHLVAV